MAKKGEFILEMQAADLGLTLENLAVEAEAAFKKSVADVAVAAFAQINAKAQQELSSTLNDYRRGLNFQKIGEDSYLISLEGDWANALEKGYGPFSIRDRMLKSTKNVEVGPRAGLPWVQKAKDGHKYAHVPFEHKPFSKAPQAADMASLIKKISAPNAQGGVQAITKIFRDINGNAIDSGTGKATKPVARAVGFSGLDQTMKNLEGMVKYQKVTPSKTGKEIVQSIYHTYRTVSEAGLDWTHPGFKGVKAFDDVEKYVAEQLDNILKAFLS